jgi:hypothetical protein
MVIICAASFNIFPHNEFICFVQFSQSTRIIFLHSIELLVILMEKLYVFCEVRTEIVHVILLKFNFQKWHVLHKEYEGLKKVI